MWFIPLIFSVASILVAGVFFIRTRAAQEQLKRIESRDWLYTAIWRNPALVKVVLNGIAGWWWLLMGAVWWGLWWWMFHP